MKQVFMVVEQGGLHEDWPDILSVHSTEEGAHKAMRAHAQKEPDRWEGPYLLQPDGSYKRQKGRTTLCIEDHDLLD